MGVYIPRIVSPITGEEAAAPATGSMMRQDAENLRRFKGWWAVANKEQLVSFWFICVFSITVFSTLAYSTVFGQNISSGQANLAFIKAEGEALKTIVAPWFGTFFWVFGSLSMILVALGTVDYISRIVADVLKTVYLQQSQRWTESRIYFLVAWGTIAAGSIILLSGFNQPLLLLVIAACLNGMVMFVYSILLIQLNRRGSRRRCAWEGSGWACCSLPPCSTDSSRAGSCSYRSRDTLRGLRSDGGTDEDVRESVAQFAESHGLTPVDQFFVMLKPVTVASVLCAKRIP